MRALLSLILMTLSAAAFDIALGLNLWQSIFHMAGVILVITACDLIDMY